MTRALPITGLHNAWDLGGLPLDDDDRDTVRGRVYRSPRLDALDDEGWDALLEAGVRTIVDLRNDDEVAPLGVPAGITVHRAPIEDQGDVEFMARYGEHLNSPRYYPEVLRRWPDLVIGALRPVAEAPSDGAVLIHCAGGRDRTGLIAAMLLQLAGVMRAGIVNDYWLAVIATNFHLRENPRPHDPWRSNRELGPWLDQVTGELHLFLDAFDAETWLREHGAADLIEPLRARLRDAWHPDAGIEFSSRSA